MDYSVSTNMTTDTEEIVVSHQGQEEQKWTTFQPQNHEKSNDKIKVGMVAQSITAAMS